MDVQRRRELARETVEAFNRADYARIRELEGPGFTYAEAGTGDAVQGGDEFEALMRGWRGAMPDLTGDVTAVAVDGDVVVLEITWSGTQTGPLETPVGTIPASGRSTSVAATLWQRWDGEQMVEERHHLDLFSMLTQLGALPAPASA